MSHKGNLVDLKQPWTVPDQRQRAQNSCGASIPRTSLSRDQPGTPFGLLHLEAEEPNYFTVLSRDDLDQALIIQASDPLSTE